MSLRRSTPQTTEIMKLSRYHAHSVAMPPAAKATPKPRLTMCWRKPATHSIWIQVRDEAPSPIDASECDERTQGRVRNS
eukprot:scaffold197958_cov27-Tisochrysis_lutea.AAC.2